MSDTDAGAQISPDNSAGAPVGSGVADPISYYWFDDEPFYEHQISYSLPQFEDLWGVVAAHATEIECVWLWRRADQKRGSRDPLWPTAAGSLAPLGCLAELPMAAVYELKGLSFDGGHFSVLYQIRPGADLPARLAAFWHRYRVDGELGQDLSRLGAEVVAARSDLLQVLGGRPPGAVVLTFGNDGSPVVFFGAHDDLMQTIGMAPPGPVIEDPPPGALGCLLGAVCWCLPLLAASVPITGVVVGSGMTLHANGSAGEGSVR